MRTRHLLTAIASLSVVALLSGCTPAKPYDKTATSTSSPTPVFASEEEALAAAEEVYARYLELTAEIMSDGGERPERMKEVATGDLLELLLDEFAQVRLDGIRGTGEVSVRDIRLQSYDQAGGADFLIVYACEDVSSADLLDAQGNSLVSGSRPPTTTFQTSFDYLDGELHVSGHVAWRNESC